MRNSFGPGIKSLQDARVALDDVVLLNVVRLELSRRNGHAKTDFKYATALSQTLSL